MKYANSFQILKALDVKKNNKQHSERFRLNLRNFEGEIKHVKCTICT